MTTPPYPCPTTLWHNTTYSSISPTNSGLSFAGKTIVVTGGGSGIGRETALAFAEAGAAQIHLFGGRREAVLEDAKREITERFNGVEVLVQAVDITDETAVREASGRVRGWDVLVLNSGAMFQGHAVQEAGVGDWWRTFEVNVKGNFLVVHHLLPKRKSNASLLGCSAGSISVPPAFLPGHSAYNSSKIALTKLLEFVAAETQDLFVASFHPGIVETDLFAIGGKAGSVPTDTVQLPAHFTVWLASEEARFLRGKFVWCNWDVDELKANAEQTKADPLIYTSNIVGWPFAST